MEDVFVFFYFSPPSQFSSWPTTVRMNHPSGYLIALRYRPPLIKRGKAGIFGVTSSKGGAIAIPLILTFRRPELQVGQKKLCFPLISFFFLSTKAKLEPTVTRTHLSYHAHIFKSIFLDLKFVFLLAFVAQTLDPFLLFGCRNEPFWIQTGNDGKGKPTFHGKKPRGEQVQGLGMAFLLINLYARLG